MLFAEVLQHLAQPGLRNPDRGLVQRQPGYLPHALLGPVIKLFGDRERENLHAAGYAAAIFPFFQIVVAADRLGTDLAGDAGFLEGLTRGVFTRAQIRLGPAFGYDPTLAVEGGNQQNLQPTPILMGEAPAKCRHLLAMLAKERFALHRAAL